MSFDVAIDHNHNNLLKKTLIFVDQFRLARIVVGMAHESRKERLQTLLSKKRHTAAVHSKKAPVTCFMASVRCCASGEWKLAATYFTRSMNLIWTTIVNPNAGANRKP